MTSSRNAGKGGARRVLALDYGRKRIGMAISDELRLTARPLATLERRNRRDDLRRLRKVVKEYGIAQIVVGNPIRLDGTAGETADEAERFAARIGKELRLPVEMVDERLSSWEAEETSRARKVRRGRPGTDVDAVAAAVILRDFLERSRAENRAKK